MSYIHHSVSRTVVANIVICSLTLRWPPVSSLVLSLHSVAGGGDDVHPGVVLEIFCGAPPAVGPQLHHGGAGPVLQLCCHSGQTHGHLRAAHPRQVQKDTWNQLSLAEKLVVVKAVCETHTDIWCCCVDVCFPKPTYYHQLSLNQFWTQLADKGAHSYLSKILHI